MAGEAASLHPLLETPYGVEVTSRQDDHSTYYFLLNMTETAHKSIELPHPMEDLIGKRSSVTQIALRPFDVAILASPKRL